MKSDIISIDNQGNGFENAIKETQKVAVYKELNHQDSIRLELITEEMLSLARSVTGEMQATFFIETEGLTYYLHLSTETVMDREKRDLLLSTATSRKNEAAKSFLGWLRNAFEESMATDVNRGEDLPNDVLDDVVNHTISCTDEEWDRYEQSTLRKLADEIKIGIVGGKVDMTVKKIFA
jgi:hypothetical protein